MSTTVGAERRIPVCAPLLGGREVEYVREAVESTWISSRGKFLDRFEREFPAYVGVKYGSGTCNGTVALHLALRALGIGPGDEVILPSFTMIASAYSVCYCGAVPVLVDADPDDWNMDVNRLEEAISPRTRAIMVVHIYGHPTDMDAVNAIAKKYSLAVVEDAAEAHGSEYKARRCGSLGDIAAFSFFANKNITCGEGGMVVTDSEELWERSRYFKNLCFPLSDARRYEHDEIGFNYRMSNIHAALGCAQLERADDYVTMRRRNAALYAGRLRDIPGITLPVEKPWAKNTYWMFGILVGAEFGMNRDALMRRLAEAGVETRAFFQPMHLQRSIQDHGFRAAGSLDVSERLGREGLYLPSSSGLALDEIDYVAEQLQRARATFH